MTTATKTAKGFKVACPNCGETDSVTIDLNDLRSCSCGSCSEEFTPQEARAKAAEALARWEAVCRWVEMAGEAMGD